MHEKKRSEDFVDGIRGNSVSQKESSLFQDTAKVEEFPLSMAIVVSDESKTPHDRNWDRETPTYRPPRARKKGECRPMKNFE